MTNCFLTDVFPSLLNDNVAMLCWLQYQIVVALMRGKYNLRSIIYEVCKKGKWASIFQIFCIIRR